MRAPGGCGDNDKEVRGRASLEVRGPQNLEKSHLDNSSPLRFPVGAPCPQKEDVATRWIDEKNFTDNIWDKYGTVEGIA